ncbi:unnamed protein product [Mytilus edulis]|uniref:Uncharacterized protein n=1 Tax=Mytilus edulis TaxID=6550 RepID=A0A8S3PMX7_MYTED|nr:unnamed protein product [Mytilus edulis]
MYFKYGIETHAAGVRQRKADQPLRDTAYLWDLCTKEYMDSDITHYQNSKGLVERCVYQRCSKCGTDAMEKTGQNPHVKGVKGISILHAMDWFHIVNGIVPDYMHGVLLGVTKKMLGLMTSSSNSGESFFVKKNINKIDEMLMEMKPTDVITRLPRMLEEHFHSLKVSEFQILLLFISWTLWEGRAGREGEVKEKTGGGVRKLEVDIDTKAEELMQTGIDLFFIDGQSSHGSISELDFVLRDFKQSKVKLTSTVNELYETSRIKLLRLYIFTKKKMPEHLTPLIKPRSNHDSLRNTKEELPTPLKPDLPKQTVNVNKGNEVMPLQTALTSTFLTLPLQSISISPPMLPDLHFEDRVISSCHSSTQSIGDCSLMDFSDLIVSGPSDTINSEMLSETSVHLRIHRVNVLNELISHFKSANILNLKFKFEFVNECGSDVSGVSRDVYSSFWNIFLLKSAEGEEARVPCLASKWQNEEWKAIGRILLKGYTDCGYFPLQLAPAYAIALIFGEMSVTPEILLSSFMSYLSCSDRETVTAAINDALPEENLDDLTDILDQFGHNIPPQDQMKYTFNLIAHKEIIQKPKYALSGMAEA